jgi:hypothetical protein
MFNQNINDHAVEVILDHNWPVCTDTNISVISAVITIIKKQEILGLVYTVSKSDFLYSYNTVFCYGMFFKHILYKLYIFNFFVSHNNFEQWSFSIDWLFIHSRQSVGLLCMLWNKVLLIEQFLLFYFLIIPVFTDHCCVPHWQVANMSKPSWPWWMEKLNLVTSIKHSTDKGSHYKHIFILTSILCQTLSSMCSWEYQIWCEYWGQKQFRIQQK